MSRFLGAILVSLLFTGAAAGPPAGSDLDKFRYQPGKIRLNEVAHYVKSNLDGSKPTRVSIFVAAPDRIERGPAGANGRYQGEEPGERWGALVAPGRGGAKRARSPGGPRYRDGGTGGLGIRPALAASIASRYCRLSGSFCMIAKSADESMTISERARDRRIREFRRECVGREPVAQRSARQLPRARPRGAAWSVHAEVWPAARVGPP